MSETIVRSRIGATTYLAPAQPLNDETGVAGLQGAGAACLAARELNVVLDLAKVAVVNGRALEAMLDLHDRLSTLGGRLRLANPNALVREILLATGIGAWVEVMDAAGGEPPGEPLAAATSARKPLGEILLQRGLVSAERLEEAAALQKQTGRRIGQILVDKGWVPEAEVLRALGAQLGLPYVSLRPGMYDPDAVNLLPRERARRHHVLPLFKLRNTLTLATAEPQSLVTLDEIEAHTGCRTRIVLARREDIAGAQGDAYEGVTAIPDYTDALADDLEVVENQIPDDYTKIDEMAGGSPVINLVNAIIQRAIRDRASDIHLEISRNRSRVRFRIDGVLYEVMTPRVELHPALVSRLKVMANLDIAERRLPQDGRIQVATQGRTVDLRFSSLPGIYGEKVVLRVLDKTNAILDLDKLGMSEGHLAHFKEGLDRSHGLFLVTGPTGSGKTTTLYAAVNYLKSMERNIVTIEDPVEYQIDIVNQNQVNDAIGLGFARLLRHVLRQDPDIIMVGEIRDRQTAEIAVQAALTGHMVLSTLHTNDAVGAVARLLDMGVEPYLLSSALAGVVAQRLVRHVCPDCKTTYVCPPEVAARYGWRAEDKVRLVRGRGCRSCYDSGYRGRLAIHELLEADEGLQRLIVSSAGREAVANHLRESGFRTLFDDGLERVLQGHTTIEEISRAVNA